MSDHPKILHVEDDADIREIALLALETVGGLGVVQCGSGQEALASVADIAPDLLLLDVMMPGLDGRETMAGIRALDGFGDIPAIFMTARAQTAEVEELIALGALDVIVKPFDPMTLADEILTIWNRSGAIA